MGMPVTREFSIDISSWLPGPQGPDEFRQTAGSLHITIGDKVATRIEDDWSKSVQQSARVSAYPLALWIASSWWRLRWESQPFRSAPDVAWRRSHEMPGAGHGFLWPLVTFESDGEEVSVVCRPSNPLSDEPVRYLSDFREAIAAWDFEKTLDGFVDLVLARLAAVGISHTHLHDLWGEVREERADPVLARSRRLEACLGFEPDEAPGDLMQRMHALSDRAGTAAVDELAPVCAGSEPVRTLDQIEQFSALPGTDARISLPESFTAEEFASAAPWEKGRDLARKARHVCEFGTQPVSDQGLADVLGIPVEKLEKPSIETPHPPLGSPSETAGRIA